MLSISQESDYRSGPEAAILGTTKENGDTKHSPLPIFDLTAFYSHSSLFLILIFFFLSLSPFSSLRLILHSP